MRRLSEPATILRHMEKQAVVLEIRRVIGCCAAVTSVTFWWTAVTSHPPAGLWIVMVLCLIVYDVMAATEDAQKAEFDPARHYCYPSIYLREDCECCGYPTINPGL